MPLLYIQILSEYNQRMVMRMINTWTKGILVFITLIMVSTGIFPQDVPKYYDYYYTGKNKGIEVKLHILESESISREPLKYLKYQLQ